MKLLKRYGCNILFKEQSMKYRIKFEWEIVQYDEINIEASSEDEAIQTLDKMLRDRNNPKYEDPYLWLPEDHYPLLNVKSVTVID